MNSIIVHCLRSRSQNPISQSTSSRVSGCNSAQSSRSARFLNVNLFIGPLTNNLTRVDFSNHGTFRETTPFVTAPILQSLNNCISASEGLRDFREVAKCSQWPHLYQSYEATYTLKCIFFEKIAKNRFFAVARGKKQLFVIFSKNKHFRVYVASQHQYKYGHCEHFDGSGTSLKPSEDEIQST